MDFIMYLIEENPDTIFTTLVLLIFLLSLYKDTSKKTKPRIYKAPTKRKIKRHTKITVNRDPNKIKLDKDQSYIDACWEEFKKH